MELKQTKVQKVQVPQALLWPSKTGVVGLGPGAPGVPLPYFFFFSFSFLVETIVIGLTRFHVDAEIALVATVPLNCRIEYLTLPQYLEVYILSTYFTIDYCCCFGVFRPSRVSFVKKQSRQIHLWLWTRLFTIIQQLPRKKKKLNK